jgi:alpha-amylase
MVGFHNAMQSKAMEVLFADDCALLWLRGTGRGAAVVADGIVGINKCGEGKAITLDTHGRFRWGEQFWTSHLSFAEARYAAKEAA